MATERVHTPHPTARRRSEQPSDRTSPQPPRGTARRRRRLVPLGALAAAALVLAAMTGCQSSSASDPYAAPSDTSTVPTYPYPTPTPTDPDTAPVDPYSPPADTTPPSPSPYDSGTCLNGTLPDSTTAQTVSDVNQVDCSADDAHYKVIQVFYETTDLGRCDDVPDTQYSFSSQVTWNGATINSYVYCLVGLGSYAR